MDNSALISGPWPKMATQQPILIWKNFDLKILIFSPQADWVKQRLFRKSMLESRVIYNEMNKRILGMIEDRNSLEKKRGWKQMDLFRRGYISKLVRFYFRSRRKIFVSLKGLPLSLQIGLWRGNPRLLKRLYASVQQGNWFHFLSYLDVFDPSNQPRLLLVFYGTDFHSICLSFSP